MTPPSLIQLAERVEAASADQQAEMLREAWAAINPCPNGTLDALREWSLAEHRFARVLAADAYESAAMSLVPEGALWEVEHKINIGLGETFETPDGEPRTDFRAGVGTGDVPAQWSHGRSFASPALALAAAALRAIASQEQGK